MAMSKCRECGKGVSTLAKTCPHCGIPKPTKKSKKVLKKTKPKINKKVKKETKEIQQNIEKISENFKKVWVHCSNRKCRDFTQMYQIYESYVGHDTCNLCKSKFTKASLREGKPIMPTTGASYSASASRSSGSSVNYKSSNVSNSTSAEKGAYDKFLDGSLDLATAFWLFGIFGSFIASFGLTLLAESVSKIFYIPFVAVNVGIIACLWECAENYKKEKLQKKQSAVWGYLTQVFCFVGALGLISTTIDIFKTL